MRALSYHVIVNLVVYCTRLSIVMEYKNSIFERFMISNLN